MHTIRANLYWEFQFVLGYIAVPRSRIRPGNPLRVGRGNLEISVVGLNPQRALVRRRHGARGWRQQADPGDYPR